MRVLRHPVVLILYQLHPHYTVSVLHGGIDSCPILVVWKIIFPMRDETYRFFSRLKRPKQLLVKLLNWIETFKQI